MEVVVYVMAICHVKKKLGHISPSLHSLQKLSPIQIMFLIRLWNAPTNIITAPGDPVPPDYVTDFVCSHVSP
jgi:hypothetical protein